MDGIYESDKVLAEYLLFHYGSKDEVLPEEGKWPAAMDEALGFTQRTVAHYGDAEVETGLDLGCAVGRSSFEMARTCRQVVGIDFSQAFIEAAAQLAQGKELSYERLEEGRHSTSLVARAPEGVDVSRLKFCQGDAMNLSSELGPFDRVHAANLICRLPEPLRLLDRLPSLVVTGGELVLATPATWLEEFTPSCNWPAGSTRDWLVDHLTDDFELIREREEPFLIRETARKFQWSRSLVTFWRRL